MENGSRIALLIWVIFLAAFGLIGCSGAANNPVLGEIEDSYRPGESTSSGSRSLWGAYHLTIDVEEKLAEVRSFSREGYAHFDITAVVTPPACDDCLTADLIDWRPEKRIVVIALALKNKTSLTGYDVRAIFRDYDLKEFYKPAGYTRLWGSGEPAPYYPFAIEIPDRSFHPSTEFKRYFEVYFPADATPEAVIVIDASWPGQCKEPYEVQCATSSWLINDGTDNAKIVAYVSDHQDDIESVTADLTPIGGPPVVEMFDDGHHGDGEDDDGIFAVQGITTTYPLGNYDCFVSCKSEGSNIITYGRALITVSDIDPYRGDPIYGKIFDDNQVKKIEIIISPSDWLAMLDDLNVQMFQPWHLRDYKYFECTVNFEDVQWEHVGVRFKGNSSIDTSYNMGSMKHPLRLDFDEYEDKYPETSNQRFWGAKWMTFSNHDRDPSGLREKLTYDLLETMAVPASRAAHYRIFVDHGTGPVYFGLYSSCEVVDERFLEDRFGNHDGNLYEPEGPGSDLTYFQQGTFEKKTNEDDDDYSDIINFINVLNAPYSTTDEFKAAIEQVFDVNSFINYLVVNSVLCNLDSYPGLECNYYLYNNPSTGKFHFIPWDHNLSFGTYPGSLDYDTIPEWDILHPVDGGYKPLVERVLWVPQYMNLYKVKVRAFLDYLLDGSVINPRIDYLHDLARPYVIGPKGESWPNTLLSNSIDFDANVDYDVPPYGPQRILGLKPFLADRKAYIDSVIP